MVGPPSVDTPRNGPLEGWITFPILFIHSNLSATVSAFNTTALCAARKMEMKLTMNFCRRLGKSPADNYNDQRKGFTLQNSFIWNFASYLKHKTGCFFWSICLLVFWTLWWRWFFLIWSLFNITLLQINFRLFIDSLLPLTCSTILNAENLDHYLQAYTNLKHSQNSRTVSTSDPQTHKISWEPQRKNIGKTKLGIETYPTSINWDKLTLLPSNFICNPKWCQYNVKCYKWLKIGRLNNNSLKFKEKRHWGVPIPPKWWHRESVSPLAFWCSQAVK